MGGALATGLQGGARGTMAGGAGGEEGDAEWAPFFAEAQRMEREGKCVWGWCLGSSTRSVLTPPPPHAHTRSYADAQLQYEVVLERKTEQCGPESVPVASVHRDLGRVLALQRRFEPAESHYATAVSLCARLLGEKHPNTAVRG